LPSDEGLLSPVAAGLADGVSDAAVADALVAAEIALVRAYGARGAAPAEVVAAVSDALGWRGDGMPATGHGVSVADLAAAAVAGGNPVIPLVGMLRERVPAAARGWIHRGATSQDVLDSALMLVAARAADGIRADLAALETALAALAAAHRDEVAAATTLTQHAVPTTIGLRIATWLRGVRRADARLAAAREALPAQLGGAAGTLASFAEILGSPEDALALVGPYAAALGLAEPEAPWHTTRWPVTELGDALVQTLDALGVLAGDVASRSRTEIGELAEGSGGGSSAMPQKRNPAESVLIRSAALRAPQLGATLHAAAAAALDERPDGAWQAEWPALRELLRLGLGAASHARHLAEGLRVDADAVSRNLRITGPLLVAERLSLALGADAVAEVVAAADPESAVRTRAAAVARDAEDLLDPARYTGAAALLVDRALAPVPSTPRERAYVTDSAPEEDTGAFSATARDRTEGPVLAHTPVVGPEGAPVLLLGPSLGTSTVLWETVVPALATHYRVVAWDLPGHGAGPAAGAPFTIDDLADALGRFAAALDDRPALLAGVSMGGATSLTLALRHPSRVRAVAMLASGAQLGDPDGWRDRAAQVRAQSTSSIIVASAQRWFAPGSMEREPEISGRLLHALQDADDESYALCCEALAVYDVRDRLGAVGAPVLAAWGADDLVAPEAKSAEVAAGAPVSRLVRIDGAAHLPPAEQPAATAEALLSFFADVLRED
jgi:3-carboxy-cis,cis-muconate cycloisomerase